MVTTCWPNYNRRLYDNGVVIEVCFFYKNFFEKCGLCKYCRYGLLQTHKRAHLPCHTSPMLIGGPLTYLFWEHLFTFETYVDFHKL